MQETMTMHEAARYLGVSRNKLWLLVKEGRLTAVENPLDKRQRLLDFDAVRRLRDEARSPSPSRKLPRSIGLYDGPVQVHSDEVKEYLRTHWRPE
jgi:excisionase family DNA binding protein